MLTAEQRKTVEESIWIVNTVLKKLGLQTDDDMRQTALLYMCSCIQRFDNTRGVKWSTFAYKSIYLYVVREKQTQRKKDAQLVEESKMFYMSDNYETQYKLDNSCQIQSIISPCTSLEKQVATLLSQGYTINEIATALKTGETKVRHIKKSLRYKIKSRL